MDDETHSNGMSAFEGYALGKLSERSHQVLGDAAEVLGAAYLAPLSRFSTLTPLSLTTRCYAPSLQPLRQS